MSASWVTFVFESANFLLLAAVLGWLFFRPVRDALERRRRSLEDEQRETREARDQAARALQELDAKRGEVEESLEKLRAQLRSEAETEKAQLLESAREQAGRERDMLRDELASQRRTQTDALARDAAWAAREIVARLLDALDGPSLEQALRDGACRALQALREAAPLAPVVVESAEALDDAARSGLAKAAGVAPEALETRVDADLIAGLRVLTARGLVDRSVSGLATRAEQALRDRLERERSERG